MDIIKPTWKTEIVPIVFIVLSFVASLYFYANFPEIVPTHWNFAGEPDSWSSREFGAFFFPALIAGLYGLFLLIPAIDPRKKRYVEFRKPYHIFKAVFVGLMASIYFATGLNVLGLGVPINVAVPLLVGVLLVVMGNYMGKIRRNWFFGVRTPWTLSSEEVWNRTHRLAGKLFILAGIVIAASSFVAKSVRVPLFFSAVVVMALAPIVYSYFLHRRIGGP